MLEAMLPAFTETLFCFSAIELGVRQRRAMTRTPQSVPKIKLPALVWALGKTFIVVLIFHKKCPKKKLQKKALLYELSQASSNLNNLNSYILTQL